MIKQKKVFILDTNVLIHDPDSIFKFKDNILVIPLIVLEELDRLKTRKGNVAKQARMVLRHLDDLREKGNLVKGVELESGGIVRIGIEKFSSLLKEFPLEASPDNYILELAYAYSRSPKLQGFEVILVSKDVNMRVKADALGIKAEDYESDKVNITEVLKGYEVLNVSHELLNKFKEQSFVDEDYVREDSNLPEEFEFYENQCLLLKNEESSRSELAKFKNGKIVKLYHLSPKPWGITARNLEQAFALELLLCDDIKLVSLIGKAGTGKTLLALAAGLQKVVEEGAYKKLLVARPVIPMGQDIGYLPGSKDEKLRFWMQPITDNLEFLFNGDMSNYEMFKDKGMIELEALTYIRGRSLPNTFFIIDEAQNLTPHEVKTIITRAGEGSKIILTGDPYQIDNQYLTAADNGLSYAAIKFKGQELAANIALQKGERSKLADLAASLL